MTRFRVRLAALALASLVASNPVFAAEGSATGNAPTTVLSPDHLFGGV